MPEKVTLPILTGGKFIGQALTHISEIADNKVSALERKTAEAISKKADMEAVASRFVTQDRAAGVFNLRQFSGDTASAKIATAYRELGELQGESVLQVSDDIVLDAPLELDIKNVSIDFQGRKLNASRIKDAPAITLTNTTGKVLPMNRRAFRNLQLIGPGAGSAGSIGMRFYTRDATGTDNARGALFENVELEGFETGLSFGKNAYLLRFINGHAYKCGTCVRVEDKSTLGDENKNYGENLAFFGWSFGNSKLGVYLGDNDLTDVNMYGCSFDFLQGGGQRMAVVKSGQLNLTDAHIEFNGELTAGPIISVGPLAAAEVRIKGSRIQHNNVPPANVDYWFESLNPYGSGGLTITDSTLHFVKSNSGYLCDGPGSFHTRNITFPSGTDGSFYAAETVLTSKAQSLLRDPEFSLPEHIDFKVQESSATSATSSPAVSVSNRAGKMVITKHTTGSGSIALTVPVEPGRWYSQGFTLESYQTTAPTGPGKLRLNDQFISENGQGAFGQVIPGRVVSRGEASWDVTALPGVPKRFGAGYQGSGKKPLPRKAPYWATHYRVIIPVTDLAPGEYVFSEFVVTGL